MLVWTMASCQQETYDTAAIRTAVHGQMEAFPASRLQDLYKGFFQDRFGPGHIIDDRQSARDYISYELSSADTLMGPEVFPCGWEGNYVRVNLSLLAEGRITVDELTDVLMETLAIIAYKQPVTKLEIEKIRGVKSDHAVNRLIEYNLVCEVGRMNVPGRPILFGTTEEFLRRFSIQSLEDLPSMNEEQMESFKSEAEEEAQLKLNI